jgi:general secretion pathway protein I
MIGAEKGFTLLEVLVALVILAVASAGLIGAAGQSIQQLNRLQEKTFAGWVASNKLAELRAAGLPSNGVSDETADMAGQSWKIHIAVSDTPQPDIRKAIIEVRTAGDIEAADMTGFLGRY